MTDASVNQEELLLAHDVAALLGVTPARIRQLAVAGALPHIATVGGVRLFRAVDVEALREQREAQRA